MKEKELVALGFTRVDVTAEESGCDTDWYYFTYDFGNGSFSLISNDSTQAEKDGWYVEVFDDDSISFNNSLDVMALIDLIKRNIKQ